MNRFEFARAQAYLLPCEASLVTSLGQQHEHGHCVFDGYACFVLTEAAGPDRQGEVVFFATSEELTPEVGQLSNGGSVEPSEDAAQLKCEIARVFTPNGPALLCSLDHAGYEIDVSRATGLRDSTDALFVVPESEEPLPRFVQLDFGPVALRFFESSETPNDNGHGSLACAWASFNEFRRASSSASAGARPSGDAKRRRPDLDTLLHETSLGVYAHFVDAAQRLGPTYELGSLLAELKHSIVDGNTAEQLLQKALSRAAAAHGAAFVRLEARAEVIEVLSDEMASAKQRMLKRCRAQVEQRSTGAAAAPEQDVQQDAEDLVTLSECARKVCELQMQPARRLSPAPPSGGGHQ